MTGALAWVRRVDGAVAAGVAAAACAALAVAAFACFWQVLGRFVFQLPSPWSEALTRLALVWMVMLGASVALRNGALVAIGLARDRSTGRLQLFIELVIAMSSLILFAVLVWYGWQMALRVQMQQMSGLNLSMSWAYAAIPIGAAFAVLGALVSILDILGRRPA